MFVLPHRIPGSKTPLNENLTVSILIDRALLFEVGNNVLLILSAEETTALHIYLQHHEKKFTGGKDVQP